MVTELFTSKQKMLFSGGLPARDDKNFANNQVKVDFSFPDPDSFAAKNNSLGVLQHFNKPSQRFILGGIAQVFSEMGWRKAAEILEKGSGVVSLPYGVKAKLNLSEKEFSLSDKYIQQDKVRKIANIALKQNQQNSIWVETNAVIDFSNSSKQNLVIDESIKVGAKEKFINTWRYRRLEPVEVTSGFLEKGLAAYRSLIIPLSAVLAKDLPVGSEFELTCSGRGAVNPEISTTHNVSSNGSVNLSLKSEFGLTGDIEANSTILVQKLPNPNQVLVKISTAKESSSSIYLRFTAAITSKFGSYLPFKKIYLAVAKFFSWCGYPLLMQDFSSYNGSVATESKASEDNKTVIRYVFDLSCSDANAAYDDIFRLFSTRRADELANNSRSGVRSQGSLEQKQSIEYNYQAVAGETPVLLSADISDSRSGFFFSGIKKNIVFRQEQFSKKYLNWFYGSKKISWDSVVLQDESSNKKEHYYHLFFSNQDRSTYREEIESFFNFSNALGINLFKNNQFSKDELVKSLEILGQRQDTKTAVDLFFTDKGIQNIQKSSIKKLEAAYLVALQKLRDIPNSSPFFKNANRVLIGNKEQSRSYIMVARYLTLMQKGFWNKWWYYDEIHDLEDKYLTLYAGQIAEDAAALKEAVLFAERMSLLKNDKESRELDKFFAHLGKSQGFDFTKTISAMVLLAEEKETLIHDLSLIAGGLSLRHLDEGEIIHPEHEILEELAGLT